MTPIYSSLAMCYDKLNGDIDYDIWAKSIAARLKKNGVPDGSLVLDLACGTGNVTLPLAKLGYDMIAVDISPEMLDIARAKPCEKSILWLCQDMRSFELYGTVGAVVCCLDSINYITGRTGLKKCFSLVHNYTDPDGIFIFDVNSSFKFRKIYGDNHYILESDDVYCGWKNHYDTQKGICDFELSVFAKQGAAWHRFDEIQREKYWSIKVLTEMLSDTGFTVLSVSSDMNGAEVNKDSERWFFVCRVNK